MIGKIAVSPPFIRNIDGMPCVVFPLLNESRSAAWEIVNHCKYLVSQGKDKFLLTVDKLRKSRSNQQNKLMWAMLKDLSDIVRDPPMHLYRHFIIQAGQFDVLYIAPDAIKRFTADWERRGDGWQAIDKGASEIDGMNLIFAYYGSSVYSTEEMNALMDAIEQECKQWGIAV